MVAIASIVIKLEYVKALIPTDVMWKPQEHIYFKGNNLKSTGVPRIQEDSLNPQNTCTFTKLNLNYKKPLQTLRTI